MTRAFFFAALLSTSAPAFAAETITYTYDARGRLVKVERTGTVNNGVTTNYTIDKADNRTKDAENNLTTYVYDGFDRLFETHYPVQTKGAGTSSATDYETPLFFAYDDLDRIAEFDGNNAVLRRYVHGPGMDEPIVWYEGSGTTDRRFLSSDERGSIVSVTNSSGTLLGINRYDEFGQPQSTNFGTFGYTGQAWLPTMGIWYYKARVYDPELGRFLQADPVGYADSPNLYAYVLSDPTNLSDWLGQCTGTRIEAGCGGGGIGGSYSGFSTAGVGGQQETGWQIVGKYIDLTELTDLEIRRLAFQLWQLLEGGAAQLGSLMSQCRGHYSCEDWATNDLRNKIVGLLNNPVFINMALTAWKESSRTHREVGFGGIGYADFRATTNFIYGRAASISKEQVARIAASGAIVFFHTHPNLHLFPGLSIYDQGVYQKYGFFGAVYGFNGWYWYDATAFKKR